MVTSSQLPPYDDGGGDDGDDVRNVDEEGGGLRAPVEHKLDVVDTVGDDHGEDSSALEVKEEGGV